MDKITYLAELAEGLARWVPERERQNILRYYAEYFEEAGPDREAEVVAELGDPWALSCRLAVEGGYVTYEKAASWKHRIKWPGILIGTAVGLSIFALVFGFGLLAVNAVRNAGGFVRNSVFAEMEQVTFVDWGMSPVVGEVEVAYGYNLHDPSAWGPYFIDGESVAPFNSIDADLSLGSIQVVAGDGFTLSVSRSEAMSGYEPTWEIRDGTLRLRDSSRAQWGLTGSRGEGNAAVIVTVPENAALDRVSVKTGLGDVLLYGVNATTVTAETGLGNVECYEARNVRRLDLNTGMGDVNLTLEEVHTGLSIQLESGLGHVEASLPCTEGECAYNLDSGLGHVTVNGVSRGDIAERKGNAPYRLNAESGMGDINVYFTGSDMTFFFGKTE